MYRNQDVLKAVSFSLYVKLNSVSSSVPYYTINKLHTMTKVSAGAIKKRLKTLEEMGLVEYVGTDGNCVVFKSLRSKSTHKNIDISGIITATEREIQKSLRTMLVVGIQLQKDYASRLLRASHHGLTAKEVKQGRAYSRRYGYNGEYKEYGMSYAGIARRLGVSVKTAFEIVKYAVRNEFLEKKRNVQQFFVRGIGFCESKITQFFGNCFYTSNNIYFVKANTYSIHARITHGIITL